jgi:ribosome biogenesis GTPase
VVVGDRVALVGDVSGAPDTLARIVRVEPRASSLRRTADDTDPFERIIVANADQLVIVTALADPEPRPRMIDRQLVAGYDAGMDPLLCLTKADLADPDGLVAEYAPLGVPYVVTRRGGDLEELRGHLSGRMSVLVGHSGVGKSTLVNALVPDAGRATGAVNEVTGRGRHTSSSSIALRVSATADDLTAGLPAAGWIIDTPGIRSFGLGHVDPASILRSFAARSRPVADPPDGIALADAHDWEIVDRVGAGELGEAGKRRLESLQRLLEAQGGRITGADDVADDVADSTGDEP